MSNEVKYISYEEALNVYNKMIDASDGGFDGVRDEGGILATLDFVQDDMYYPDFSDKLSYLVGCSVRCSEKQMLKSPVKLLI